MWNKTQYKSFLYYELLTYPYIYREGCLFGLLVLVHKKHVHVRWKVLHRAVLIMFWNSNSRKQIFGVTEVGNQFFTSALKKTFSVAVVGVDDASVVGIRYKHWVAENIKSMVNMFDEQKSVPGVPTWATSQHKTSGG